MTVARDITFLHTSSQTQVIILVVQVIRYYFNKWLSNFSSLVFKRLCTLQVLPVYFTDIFIVDNYEFAGRLCSAAGSQQSFKSTLLPQVWDWEIMSNLVVQWTRTTHTSVSSFQSMISKCCIEMLMLTQVSLHHVNISPTHTWQEIKKFYR